MRKHTRCVMVVVSSYHVRWSVTAAATQQCDDGDADDDTLVPAPGCIIHYQSTCAITMVCMTVVEQCMHTEGKGATHR